jgi:hypothetical protein
MANNEQVFISYLCQDGMLKGVALIKEDGRGEVKTLSYNSLSSYMLPENDSLVSQAIIEEATEIKRKNRRGA